MLNEVSTPNQTLAAASATTGATIVQCASAACACTVPEGAGMKNAAFTTRHM